MSTDGSSLLFEGCPKTLDKRRLRSFRRLLIQEVTAQLGFNCLITNDQRLQNLNRDFLGHDYPTDVLSFPSGGDLASVGDMAISVDRAAAQARAFGHSLEQEIEILMLHGALHLMGMDHETDRGAMARAERQYRERFALPHALTERV